MPKTYIIIPCREGGVRLPNKALLDETGKPLFVHTYDNCKKVKSVDQVYITSDSPIIESICLYKNIPFILSGIHENGTDRVEYAATKINSGSDDIIINCQVDEPLVDPVFFDKIIDNFQYYDEPFTYHTLIYSKKVTFFDANNVKVVLDQYGYAAYFSRSQIPWQAQEEIIHIGIYGYRKKALEYMIQCHNPLAKQENLEQLNWLGVYKANCIYCPETLSINSSKDYDTFKELVQCQK